MRSVLGIDAAWSDRHPSGVALAAWIGDAWHCLRLAPSYADFCLGRRQRADRRQAGHVFDADRVLHTCRELLGGSLPDVVAVDMPLAHAPIARRRPADDAIARAFGHAKCATHSPLPDRPGITGTRLQEGLARCGFALRTAVDESGSAGSLIEVYPHVGLLGLMRAPVRVTYKASKTNTYWRGCSLAERRVRLISTWQSVLARLRRSMPGIPPDLATIADDVPLNCLKWREDSIDALLCAWMGARWLEGASIPYGDGASAVWVPADSLPYARPQSVAGAAAAGRHSVRPRRPAVS